MSRKQLIALFVVYTVSWTMGNGLFPLLPVLAGELGATPVITGYYMAFSYVALTVGTMVAGWLTDRLQRRKSLLMVAGATSVPALWAMGRAANVWQLVGLTAVLWFSGGLILNSVSTLAGLSAGREDRGKVFGILGMTSALGSLIGGLAIGPMVDQWGYAATFSILALVEVTVPAVGTLLEDKAVSVSGRPAPGHEAGAATKLSPDFLLLVTATLIAWTGAYSTMLVRSLHMNDLGFPLAAITSVTAVTGAVSLPLQPIIGRLSDRLGRKRILTLGYVVGAAGRAMLAWAASLWHFWAAAAMGSVAGASSSVGQAMATDLVPPGSLGRGMSLFHSSMWVGAILGFTATGYAVDALGAPATFLAGAVLSLIAACVLIPIRAGAPAEE